MSRLKGTNVLNTTVKGHQHEDGYVAVASDGFTVVSTLPIGTLFKSFVRTGTGLWTATLLEAPPCNLNWFDVVPVAFTGSTPAYNDFVQLGDNVGTAGTTSWDGSNPAVINFMLTNGGSAADLPPRGGFRYEIGLKMSTSDFYKNSY